MITELDQVIAAAYASEGKKEDVNKVYLALLRSPVFVPVEKVAHDAVLNEEEPFRPLFAKVEDNYFMVIFDTLERLTAWADVELGKLDYVELNGKDVVAGIGENVFLCVNIGSPYYKEFSPDEVKRLKTVVSRIEQMKNG